MLRAIGSAQACAGGVGGEVAGASEPRYSWTSKRRLQP